MGRNSTRPLAVVFCLLASPALAGQAAAPAAAGQGAPTTSPARPAGQRAAPLLGDQADGSRARPVHAIPLRDSEGDVIRPTDRSLLPFSTRRTCGADCHDVATIGRGLHFTTTAAGARAGRPGEPWILVDPETATQLPLSWHDWPGTFRPDQVGITPWAFALLFGGRTPGGIAGEREPSPELQTRWAVSGELEANCLACHDLSPAYDHAEYGRQIALENFRWAPAAASGLGLVTGAAREMPTSYDYLLPFVEDALLLRRPAISYPPERFLPGARVVFDIAREVPARRCYFCHSTADIDHAGQGRWTIDQDIHLARGMTCIDCHRHGLDHAMTRGEDPGTPSGQGTGSAASAGPSAAVSLSCRGCHLATEPERNFARGRFGAPYPRHAGLPPVHFTKLSCTACHSGPRPEGTTRRLKTSQAHRLGGLNVNKAREALPHLYSPVFATGEDGKTRPNRLMWPAFWAWMSKGGVRPMAPARVKAVMSKARVELQRAPDGNWPSLDNTTLARILQLLQADSAAEGTPVYVAGGRLHRLDGAGGISTESHQAARPYLWPVAHDVRPASQSLGARGCEDCHDAAAPIFFGSVSVDSPLASERGDSWKMSRFQKNLDTAYAADFARSFRYRPWLKGGATAAAAVLLLFLLAYVVPALGQLSAATRGEALKRILVNVVGLVSSAVSVATGFNALWSGQPLTGYWLMIHVGSAPAFAASAVLVTLFWAHRNRLGRADWNRARRPFGAAARLGACRYAVVFRKVFFWAAVTAAIPAIASVTLAMFQVLASVRQPGLLLIHRYSAWVLVASGLFFACLALVTSIRGDADDSATTTDVAPGASAPVE